MSKPSFSNIDLWLFELAEGNLSAEQVEQLRIFLLQHPELDIDKDMWQLAKVEPTAVAYPDADKLERKRRPVALVGVMVLLLLGTSLGTMYLFNGSSKSSVQTAEVNKKNDSKTALEQELESVRAQLKDQLEENSRQKEELSRLREEMENGGNSLQASNGAGNGSFGPNGNGINGNRPHANLSNNRMNGVNPGISMSLLNRSVEGSMIDQAMNASLRDLYVSNEQEIGQWDELAGHRFLTDEEITELLLSEEQWDVEEEGFHVFIEDDSKFKVREPREVDVAFSSNNDNGGRKSPDNRVGSSGVDYKVSFKKRLTRFGRAFQRMLDNPIALKNSRDPHYHIPGMTPHDVNFSTAGTLIATRVQTLSRMQWLGEPGEQLMNQIAVDGYSYGIRGGWGVQMSHGMYRNGGIHVGQVAVSYSPKISVSNWLSVEPSVRFKMGDKILDAGKMQNVSEVELERGNTQSFYEGAQVPIGRNLWYHDVGVGMLVNTKWFFAGLQLDNLFRHQDNIYSNDWQDPRRAANHLIASIGTDWESSKADLGLSPYLVYQKNDQLSELWGGLNFHWGWFNIGAATSTQLEPAASLGMKFDHFSLSYNVDYTNSAMTGQNSLSHQLSLRFLTKQNRFGRRLLNM